MSLNQNNFSILSDGVVADHTLPNTLFQSVADYQEFADERRAYHSAASDFEIAVSRQGLDHAQAAYQRAGLRVSRRRLRQYAVEDLREKLEAIWHGYFTEAEIAWQTRNPRKRIATLYCREVH